MKELWLYFEEIDIFVWRNDIIFLFWRMITFIFSRNDKTFWGRNCAFQTYPCMSVTIVFTSLFCSSWCSAGRRRKWWSIPGEDAESLLVFHVLWRPSYTHYDCPQCLLGDADKWGELGSAEKDEDNSRGILCRLVFAFCLSVCLFFLIFLSITPIPQPPTRQNHDYIYGHSDHVGNTINSGKYSLPKEWNFTYRQLRGKRV